MITFPNTMHAYNAPEENAYYSMIICHPRLFGDYLNDLMHSAPSSPVIRAPFLHKDIPYAINRLTEEQQSDAASHGVCRALIQLILARAMPLLKLEERPSPGALDLPSRVIAYISGNFRQPISLDDVAKQVGASKCHVSRIFSSKLHTDFHSYVNSFRLNLAQNLLCNTDLDILTISRVNAARGLIRLRDEGIIIPHRKWMEVVNFSKLASYCSQETLIPEDCG